MQLGNYVSCVMSAFVRQGNQATQLLKHLKAVSLILDVMLSLRFRLCPLSAVDNISRQVGPRSGPTKSLNVFIHNKGADKNMQADL